MPLCQGLQGELLSFFYTELSRVWACMMLYTLASHKIWSNLYRGNRSPRASRCFSFHRKNKSHLNGFNLFCKEIAKFDGKLAFFLTNLGEEYRVYSVHTLRSSETIILLLSSVTCLPTTKFFFVGGRVGEI